jgi:PhnB protein
MSKAIPDGYHTITPGAELRDAARAVEFFERAFGAEVRVRFAAPDGTLLHCEVQIGDSRFMFGEAPGEPRPLQAMLYVEDCDAVIARAIAAGATEIDPAKDQFYGDRNGRVRDPFGDVWVIATHKEDVSEEEMARRFRAMSEAR